MAMLPQARTMISITLLIQLSSHLLRDYTFMEPFQLYLNRNSCIAKDFVQLTVVITTVEYIYQLLY
jgi:hypothetical protein